MTRLTRRVLNFWSIPEPFIFSPLHLMFLQELKWHINATLSTFSWKNILWLLYTFYCILILIKKSCVYLKCLKTMLVWLHILVLCMILVRWSTCHPVFQSITVHTFLNLFHISSYWHGEVKSSLHSLYIVAAYHYYLVLCITLKSNLTLNVTLMLHTITAISNFARAVSSITLEV